MTVSLFNGRRRLFFCALVLVFLSGCAASTTVKQIDRLDAIDSEDPKLLVMTPDVKYYLITAGGVSEPHGEWTAAARTNFEASLARFAETRGTSLVRIPEDFDLSEDEIAYQKLYSAVGLTILANHYGPFKLPTKQGSFDWSLGPDVRILAERYDAEYALFSYYRDYQASGGRIAFAVLAAAAGVAVPMGVEQGFAALVDLETGDIVWFNRVAQGVGELRKEDGADLTVEQLFADLPNR